MLIDLLASDNYLNLNIPMINLLGLHRSVYIAFILNEQARKNSSQDGFIELARSEISNTLTFNIEEQKSLEQQLENIGVITRDVSTEESERFKVKINLNVLYSLFASSDEMTTVNIKNIVKEKTTKGTKGLSQRQKQCNELKYNLTAPNKELLEAYQGWVDGVYSNPKGFLSARSIKLFQQRVDEFAQGNLDLALKLIDIATVHGYRDATWAINLFNKDYAATFNKQYDRQTSIKPRAQLGDEIF